MRMMDRRIGRFWWAVCALGVGVLAAGCAQEEAGIRARSARLVGSQHEQLARESFNRRINGINYTLGRVAESESVRPGRLEYAAHWIDKDLRGSAQRLDANLHHLGDRIEFDVDRFEHNQPLYRETIEEIFWGKPEHIEPSAIILFF